MYPTKISWWALSVHCSHKLLVLLSQKRVKILMYQPSIPHLKQADFTFIGYHFKILINRNKHRKGQPPNVTNFQSTFSVYIVLNHISNLVFRYQKLPYYLMIFLRYTREILGERLSKSNACTAPVAILVKLLLTTQSWAQMSSGV